MKAVIFAGGVGTRLWPLSRKNSPKQFEKIVDNKSTLQLTVDRIIPLFKPKDIFIATSIVYKDLIKQQLDFIPTENIIFEPFKKDVGPAVALLMRYLYEKFGNEPVIILWSDHLIEFHSKFIKLIKASFSVIKKEKEKIIFIGQKARFPNQNLGWIRMGNKIKNFGGVVLREFKSMRYKPTKEMAEYYFRSRNYCWNLGYFVSTPKNICLLYKRLSPDIYSILDKIFKKDKLSSFPSRLKKYYKEMPTIHFDNIVLEKLDKSNAYVMYHDIGWSDIGAWDAFKEALESTKNANVVQGKVILEDTNNTLVYNLNNKQLVVCIGAEELIVVNSDDALLLTKKAAVSKLKKVVEGFEGSEYERYA